MSALAVARRRDVVSCGTHAEVPYGCGNVDARAVVAGVDRSNGLTLYALRIANNTEHPLEAKTVYDRGGARTLAIAPFSIVESLLPACASGGGAQVRVSGHALAFSLDIPAATPRHLRVPWPALGVTLTGAATLLASVVAAAVLPAFHGARPLPSPTPRVVTRTHTVVRRVTEAPLLNELDVNGSVVAGSSLIVRYGARADGQLYLIDGQGRVWARAPLTAAGISHMRVPSAAAGRSMRVVATVRRGNRRAQMATTVAVVPDASFVAAVEPTVRPIATSAPPALPSQVASGQHFVVHLGAAHGEALVSLSDASGAIVEQSDVPATVDDVELDAPAVREPKIYDVVVSIARGQGQEETVQRLRVVPTNE